MEPQRPRYVPEIPFPPYTYVPGCSPHPVSDPRGHMSGTPDQAVERPDPEYWPRCRDYLHGIDLFNHGYYWEAHEAWEQVWIAAGRKGVAADFLKGLIKLAAAGVKAREGNTSGAQRHLIRAGQLFQQTMIALTDSEDSYFGLNLHRLLGWSEVHPPGNVSAHDGTPIPVFEFVLTPES